jgi:DNA-binding response OmpR family regulator
LPQILSLRDLSILEFLLQRRGRVASKKAMADHIAKGTSGVTHNAIEVYVHRLRKLLADRGAHVSIKTVKGVGYIIDDAGGSDAA